MSRTDFIRQTSDTIGNAVWKKLAGLRWAIIPSGQKLANLYHQKNWYSIFQRCEAEISAYVIVEYFTFAALPVVQFQDD